MSFLSDNFDFERFQLSDWWKKAKKNPEQLLLGAGTPFGAKAWGKITGKDYEPFVDAMGGPYGGSTFSVGGSTDGGVYGRARDEGINTTPARNSHNVAHAIAAFYAGGYGADKLGMGGNGGGEGAGNMGKMNRWPTPQMGGQQEQQTYTPQPYQPVRLPPDGGVGDRGAPVYYRRFGFPAPRGMY